MPFAGAHGAAAVVKEATIFSVPICVPGWAKAKEMIKKDPRRQPYKSFPRMEPRLKNGPILKVTMFMTVRQFLATRWARERYWICLVS